MCERPTTPILTPEVLWSTPPLAFDGLNRQAVLTHGVKTWFESCKYAILV
jgi:hypothetical protein